MRQDWKRDLLNESGKNDEDFHNEIEDKWKLGLWENVEDVIPPLSNRRQHTRTDRTLYCKTQINRS